MLIVLMIILKEMNLFKDTGFCGRYGCLKEITGMFLMYAFIPDCNVDCNMNCIKYCKQ